MPHRLLSNNRAWAEAVHSCQRAPLLWRRGAGEAAAAASMSSALP
ncbi:MAG: hypothetical protein ACK5Y7_04240 [Betaproteobacteria bacterium]|jgi:hypothetical protein|nr:hypothetical protein [Rubrivivax sp.]